MIEMLGVLAIIGVLSVGGIMGYSKAMMRYKINKTIEQITYIAGNVRTTFASQGNYEGLDDSASVWKKAHIFPDDMWKDEYDSPQSVWEGNVYVGTVSKNYADPYHNKAFFIGYDNIPEEACIELATQDWRNAQVGLVNTYDSDGDGADLYAIPPVDIDTAVKMCEMANKNNALSLYFYFDIDTSDSYWKDKIDATMDELHGS